MQTDVRRERQYSEAAALPSPGTDPVLPPGGAAGLGQGGKDKPYLQLRNLKNLQKHHANGNLLLRTVPYLKLHSAHPAAEVGGSLSQHSAAWGRQVLHERNPGCQCASEVWNNCYAL